MKIIREAFSWNEIQSSHRLMILIVATLGLFNFFWGEIVPAGGGFGWDGVRYAEMVRNLESMISSGQLSIYHSQRILPSAIVRSWMIISGVSISDTNIIRAFELYNLALLLGACWVWKRVSDHFSLSLAGRWIGFSGIFLNYQCSKQAFYYPVLTDVTALFVAMLLLLLYIEKKPIALLFVTIIGAFCWPVVSISGAFLLLFLRAELPGEVIAPSPINISIKGFTVAHLVKLGGLVVLALSLVGFVFSSHIKWVSEPDKFFTGLPSLVAVLVACAMLVGSGTFVLAVFANLRKAKLHLVAMAIAAVLIPHYIVKLISNPSLANPNNLHDLIQMMIFPLNGLQGKLLMPIVTLGVFWGPLVLLLLLYWKAFCIEARKLGIGVVAIIGISLFLGLVGEPRFLAVGWPFFVLGIVLTTEKMHTKASFKYALATLTVLYAQFWMKINLAPWSGGPLEGLQDFPKQVYFMHYGLWMGWWAFVLQLIALFFSALWLSRTVIAIGLANGTHKAPSDAAGAVQVECANESDLLKKQENKWK